MSWFNKRPQTAAAPQEEPRDWANIKGIISDIPYYIRIRTSLADARVQAQLPYEVEATVRFFELQESGLPSSEQELTVVDQLEDWLKAGLETRSQSVLALVITGDGARRLYFYTADPQTVIRLWEDHLYPSLGTHKVALSVRPDAQWQAYRRFQLQ